MSKNPEDRLHCRRLERSGKVTGWGKATDAERHRLPPAAALIRLAAAQDASAT